ncbi:hypothetical protein JXQ31_03375 [candidate division KSB1 bacterium]|nr:hypothetical protein [candidate division KSB1 bacterium]
MLCCLADVANRRGLSPCVTDGRYPCDTENRILVTRGKCAAHLGGASHVSNGPVDAKVPE